MKLTGTKKLLIIFFALACVLAASLGVVITRSGVSVRASGSTYTGEQLVSPDASEDLNEDNSVDEQPAESDGAEDELAEEEFDERFDETAIRQVADLFKIEYELVNLYCHVNDIDAREILDILDREMAMVSYSDESDQNTAKPNEIYEESEIKQGSTIRDEIVLFKEAYSNGEINISEEDTEKDWFVSPDEVASYHSGWIMVNYRDNTRGSVVYIYKENLNATGDSDRWINITGEVHNDSNVVIPGGLGAMGRYESTWSNSTYGYINAYNGTIPTSGAHNFYSSYFYQTGYKATITLEPGQRLLLQHYMRADSGSGSGAYVGFYGEYFCLNNVGSHLEKALWYAGTTANTNRWSEIIVDGDAPTGAIIAVCKGSPTVYGPLNNWGYRRYSWYNFSNVAFTSNANYLNRSSQAWTYWVEINRKDPQKPEIVQDDPDAISYSGTNKTAYYYGTPVTLAVNPDYGAGLLRWSAYTNSGCTVVDDTVELKSRSQHGNEANWVGANKTAADLVVQSSAKGTHYIKLESATGKWADGSTQPVVFSLTIQEQYTSRPNIRSETGVIGKEKTVNYTGGYLTISFENCDPAYVGYTAPGMEIDDTQPWTSTNKTLTLRQKEQGTYSITLYLKNPAGCFWSDTKTNESISGFKFHIKEMLIDKPTVPSDGWPVGSTHTGTECEVDYDSTTKYLKITPAYQEQLVIVAAGLKYNFIDEDEDGIAETCRFEMTDSGSQTITVMPDTGYLWKDKTKTALTFKITIKAVAIDFPELAPGQGQVGNEITVTYDPAGGSAYMIINKIPKDAIAISTAMHESDWYPSDTTIPDDQIIDHNRDILKLYATEANRYVVTFALTSTNYRWKNSGTSPPVFSLTITPYKLKKPKINETLPDGYTGGHIEGETKTIYYNTNPDIGQSVTPIEDRYFKLFVGGFTDYHAGFGAGAGQVTIKYSKTGLSESWTDDDGNFMNSVANLTLLANEAGNYLIDIVPTHNYQWEDGTNDMYTFKFVVTPVFHDMLKMYIDHSGTGNTFTPVGTTVATADYNGEEKKFRIGSINIATEYFIQSSSQEDGMSYTIVDEDHNQIGWPDGFTIGVARHGVDENGIEITVLEGTFVNAGTYIIKVSLNSANYAWWDGTTDNNRDVYYTINVAAKSIGTPKINAGECEGGQNMIVHDESYLNYVEAGYDGGNIKMTIDVANVGENLKDIVEVIYDPDGNDADESSENGYGIWLTTWESGLEGEINRFIFNSVNVGYHKVVLSVKNPNYIWGNNSTEILFRIEVAYAQVDDVAFYYNANDEALELVGGNNAMANESYDFDILHHITVARSNDEFAKTPFEDMFRFEVGCNNPGYPYKAGAPANNESIGKSEVNNCFILDFADANTYYINIYLTKNYRWKSIQQIGAAMSMTFTVRAKMVSVPSIIDEGEKNADGTPAATIIPSSREKSVTYDTNTRQSIAINLGDDYRAFKVDNDLTTSFANPDSFAQDKTTGDKVVRYLAKSAGKYDVYITLTDTNNYTWAEGVNAKYRLNILTRAVSVPDAFYTFFGKAEGGIESAQYDYADVKSGTRGTLITADADGVYKTSRDYTGQWQYVFLFGYAVENQEVEITVSVDDTLPDQGNYYTQFFSAGGLVRGNYLTAKYVNKYTVKVEFKVNDEFTTPNCHWSGVSVGEDFLPREFILEINKLGVEVPVLNATADDANPTVPEFNMTDSIEWHFVYTGKTGDIMLELDKCLSDDVNAAWFMDYSDHDKEIIETKLDYNTNRLTMRIIGRAEVGKTYRLGIKLDYLNEYWKDSGVPDDCNDKEVRIVIDKLGVKAPTIRNDGDSYTGSYPIPAGKAIYSADGYSKIYTYNGSVPNAMTVTDITAGKLGYRVSDTGKVSASPSNGVDTGTDMAVTTSDVNSGTYSIIFHLSDPVNHKWDGTADDSGELTFNLVIDPVRKLRPVIDETSCIYNPLDTTPFGDPDTMKVTFYRDANNQGKIQYLVIKNFIDDKEIMNYEFVKAFEVVTGDGKVNIAGGTGPFDGLKFGSRNAGIYQVKITPTKNIGWMDENGDPLTERELVFTLDLGKLKYADPAVDDPGAPNDPTVVQTTTGYKRTVTYILDTWQSIVINGYDDTKMYLFETTSSLGADVTDRELVRKDNTGETNGIYRFDGLKAGTYTVTFKLRQPDNEYFEYSSTADGITYTFVIEKLQLDKPVFDNDPDVLLNDESVNGSADTFTAVYDSNYHGALVLNVLGDGYMTYLPDGDYADRFGYAAAPTATTELTPPPSATYLTIDDVFNTAAKQTKFNGAFANTLIGVSNPIDRRNFILLDAKETGSYSLNFTLADTANVEWKDGTNGTVKVTFKVSKKRLAAPNYNGASSKPYTGQPLTFELKDIYGLAADAYAPAPYTGLEYEVMEIITTPSTTAKITAASLDTSTNILKLTATEIGTYKIRIKIKETEHTEWAGTSDTERVFTFIVTKSAIAPEIEICDPVLADGVTADANAAADFLANNFRWPKSTSVTVKVTFPKLSVNANGFIDIDESLGLDLYYVNLAAAADKLCREELTPYVDASDLFAAAAPTAAGAYASVKNSKWSLVVTDTNPAGPPEYRYDLVYTFKLVPDSQKHPEDANGVRYIPMGNYSLHVDQIGSSTTYVVGSASRNFEVLADRAPFDTQSVFDNLVWQRYLVSDPDTVVATYSVGAAGNVLLADGVTLLDHWTNMTAADAVELDFLDNNDSYGFKIGLDSTGMNGETDVQLALQSWEVNWDGNYGGSATAKYAGSYSVSVTITAKDPKSFSFATTTYTLYYKISKILYDLDGLEWYYTDSTGNDVTYPTDGTTPFTFDGKPHSVKLHAPEAVLNKLPGLTVMYDVDDLNSQVAAKYDPADPTDDTKNYKTTVRFVTSNPNYETPDINDNDTYTVGGVKGVAFAHWSQVWGIEKATIKDGWISKKSTDGSTTLTVPKLYDNDDKVEYLYYLDDGTGTQVTEFNLTAVPTNFYVVAQLKSDPAHPEVDYANNYILVVDGTVSNPGISADPSDSLTVGGNPVDNAKKFQLSANGNISVTVTVKTPDPTDPDDRSKDIANTLQGSGFDTVPTSNVFSYNGIIPFKAEVTVDAPYTGTITVIDPVTNPNGHLLVTYYNVTNPERPIAAPTDPGRYFVKIELKDFPDDGTDYGLAETKFYFDVKKGDFDPDDVYWEYTHTDGAGNVTTAKFDPAQGVNGLWIVESVVDADGNDVSGTADFPVIGQSITFTYDGKDHNVNLVSKDANLQVGMTNNSRINAGKFTQVENTAAVAKLSFNGKYWNNPTFISTLMEWEIEKAKIDIPTSWFNVDGNAYASGDYTYTLSGGQEVKFYVTIGNIPELLTTFVTYKTYDLDHRDADGNPTLLNSNVVTKAGNYRTEFSCEDFLNDETLKQNYVLTNPADAKQTCNWQIAVREITLPFNNFSWTTFDGNSHDLISSLTILAEWEEYLSVKFEYDNGTGLADYDGTGEFGNVRFASHAGDYKYIFSILADINTVDNNDSSKNQINVAFSLGGTLTSLDSQDVTITIAKAVMYGSTWNDNKEASTVILTGSSYTSADVIDYRFTLPDGTTDVPVADVAASSNAPYIIWAYVKDEFAGDVELFTSTADPSSPHWSFTTATLSDSVTDQFEVVKTPYIAGYKENGVEHDFTYAEWQQLMLETPGFFTDEQKAQIEEGTFDWVPYLGYESAEAELEAEQAAYDAMTDEEKADYDALTDEQKAELKAQKQKEAAIRIAIYKSQTRVNLMYNGNTIEFVISNWSYYSQYLDIWQGDLTRSEAGDYSVTLVFKKAAVAPALCWGFEDTDGDGTIDSADRSPVKLDFRISFRMLTVPTIKNPTYTGSEINVLTSSLGDEGYDKWWSECEEYIDVEGATGTIAGGYTLKLKIKELYLNTIHWNNGTAKGQPGTFIIKWNVLPVYIAVPTQSGSKIVYDGNAHSVFEILTGYNNGELSKELQSLMQLANISGERGINAGAYEARFMLPDSNYAWKSATGDVDDSPLIQFPWNIQRKTLDMSKLEWNYDEKDPFQYTIENGEVQPHKIELKGLPEDLEDYVTYLTDDVIGNEKSLMGTYKTVVYFSQASVDLNNYEFANEPADFLNKYKDPDGNGYVVITWSIVERRFNIPDENTVVSFDGTVRDILSLFGFEEGWENYLDIKVEYKPLGTASTEYKPYEDTAKDDALLGYSPFNVFYLGDYRVEFNIKDGLNDEKDCVVWWDGGNKLTTKQLATLTVNPLDLTITGWQLDENGENYVIISEEYDKLSDEAKEVFEYVIRDEATGEVVTMEDVVKRGAGIEYTIEFRIKDGNDYAISKGIELGVNGTTNPYGFNSLDFVAFPGTPNAQDNVIFWLPAPTHTMLSANNVFDGRDKEWQIDDWSNYLFDVVYADFITDMMNNHGIDLSGYVSFIVPDSKYSSNVNTNDGKITVKAAGKYEIVMRLLPNVNLSWYDPDLYTFDGTNLKTKPAGTVVSDPSSLIDRKAKKLEIEIEKASVDRITDDQLESLKLMIPTLEYTGKEHDLTQLNETKAIFDKLKEKYGDLITFEGYKGTNAGDYTLYIKLTDPDSSFWNLLEPETVKVNDKSFDGYDPSFELKYVDGVIKYVKADGTEYNDGKYSLTVAFRMTKAIAAYVNADGLLDENGMPETESGAKYVVDENGKAIRYKIVDENYIEDPEGTIIAKYSLNPDGSIVEKPEMVDGKQVIDQENSVVTITRTKTSTDPYEIKWSIDSSSKAAPTLDPNVKVTYNGSEQFAEKALIGFDATVMEIVEGGSGTNVGEYTAKIRIKDENYRWREGIADEDGFVYVTWRIEKTSIDLSFVTWKFTDGTNDYADGKGMTFTLDKDGKPVVFWAELDNLPEAVKSSIRYTTNGVVGAYAGTNAGKYVTSFEIIDPYGNFENITLPETLALSVTWNIQRRLLEIPSVNTTYMIFDDEPHDLRSMLDLQEDWERYFTISVMYAKNFTAFDAYYGHDGDPFMAYGAGAYRFIFNIKSGINPVCTNEHHDCGLGKPCQILACVGWLKSSGEIIVPDEVEKPEEEGETLREAPVPVKTERRLLAVEITENAESSETAETVETETVARAAETETVTVAEQICDRLRRLTYGAQLQLHSFRKYLR